MRKILLLAVPAALALLMVAGCDESYNSAATPSSGAAAPQATAQSQPAPAPAVSSRVTTTQPLPAGWGYINERELTAGPITRN